MADKTVRMLRREAAGDKPDERASGQSCPTCGRPASNGHRPFCSQRCAQVDLFRWLGGNYRIPTAERPWDPGDGGGEDDWQ